MFQQIEKNALPGIQISFLRLSGAQLRQCNSTEQSPSQPQSINQINITKY